jgi:hypothetical protein
MRTLLWLLLAACQRTPTEIVVRVVNDSVRVPDDIDSIRLRVADNADLLPLLFDDTFCVTPGGSGCSSLPLSFTLVPGKQHPDGTTRVRVTALRAGQEQIDDAAIVPFARDTSQVIQFVLYGGCLHTDCAAVDQACGADGTCRGITPPGPDAAPDLIAADLTGADLITPDLADLAVPDLAGADLAGADLAVPVLFDLAVGDRNVVGDFPSFDLGPVDQVLTWSYSLYDSGVFYSVWADAGHVLAVGDAGGQGSIWFYNGAPQSDGFQPDTRYSGNTTLRRISGLSSGDAWAVGDNSTVLHLSGGSWSAQSTGLPAGYSQRGVWAGGPNNNVWVVGGNVNMPGSEAFDDAIYNTQLFPGNHWGLNTGIAGYARKAVWGDGFGGAIIVGHGNYSRYSLDNGTLTTFIVSGAANLWGVFGFAMSDAWLAGDDGSIWRFDVNGGTPIITAETVFPTTTAAFLDVHGVLGQLWAATNSGQLYHSNSGGLWRLQSNLPSLAGAVFQGVHVVAPNDVYVVGSYNGQKLVLHGN